MNIWDTPSDKSDEIPPPRSLDDYGVEPNVIPIKRKSRTTKNEPDDWRMAWQISETGTPLTNLRNVMVAMRAYPEFANLLKYDEMACAIILMKQIPNTIADPTIPRQIRDTDIIAIQEELQLLTLRRVAKPTVQDAVELTASQNRFHPVREYLDTLVWDGTTRVAGWLSTYLGVEGGSYADTIGQLFLVALVARQYQPGCKADYMLILEGPQGALKSSACRALAGEYFDDNLPDLGKGDAVRLSMHLRGKWLIEIGEMSSFSSAEAHTLKAFLTQTHENYVPKFGRNSVCEPRQCLFIGSTNEGAYLRDATGGRRFWPVKVGEIKIDDLITDRDQLLAEAAVLFRAGAKWWPDREFEAEHIKPEQEARYVEDPWQVMMADWVLKNPVNSCTTTDVMTNCLNIPSGQMGNLQSQRVAAILRRLGFMPKRSKRGMVYQKITINGGV